MNQQHLALAQDVAARCHEEALDLLRTLARIPAPSHHEERRARFVRDWMSANALEGVYIDEATNVICPVGDDGTCDLTVFAAHLDVVFPDTDELPLSEHDGRLFAPGVGDDTANLVALLIAARELRKLDPAAASRMLVVANSCEEGLGNLKGTRQLFATYGSRIKRFYSFDLYLPGCVDEAVGSYRWRIHVKTQGGHSFKDYGLPNAVERLCALIGELYALPFPEGALCTRNVGTIAGGSTINAIASQAEATFEFRSTSDEALRELAAGLARVIEHHRSDTVDIELESLGERPASSGQSEQLRRMTEVSLDVIRSVTGEEPVCAPASTDANIPLSRGIAANTLGAIRGGLLHTRDEWVDAQSLREGIAVALGIMLEQGTLDS